MGLLMLTYPITRFLIERLRNDEGVYYAGLTISQVISVGLFAVGLIYAGVLSQMPAVRYVDIVKPDHPEPVLEGATILP